MKNIIISLTLTALVAGCASSPESIAASYVSPSNYERLSCSQLASERNNVTANLNSVVAAQERAADNDAAIVTASVLLLPIAALFAMGGNDFANEIATGRGQLNAINSAFIAKGC